MPPVSLTHKLGRLVQDARAWFSSPQRTDENEFPNEAWKQAQSELHEELLRIVQYLVAKGSGLDEAQVSGSPGLRNWLLHQVRQITDSTPEWVQIATLVGTKKITHGWFGLQPLTPPSSVQPVLLDSSMETQPQPLLVAPEDTTRGKSDDEVVTTTTPTSAPDDTTARRDEIHEVESVTILTPPSSPLEQAHKSEAQEPSEDHHRVHVHLPTEEGGEEKKKSRKRTPTPHASQWTVKKTKKETVSKPLPPPRPSKTKEETTHKKPKKTTPKKRGVVHPLGDDTQPTDMLINDLTLLPVDASPRTVTVTDPLAATAVA